MINKLHPKWLWKSAHPKKSYLVSQKSLFLRKTVSLSTTTTTNDEICEPLVANSIQDSLAIPTVQLDHEVRTLGYV